MTSEGRSGELLVVFVKYPEPGRVKTRLAAGIGAQQAAGVYRELVSGALAAVGGWQQAGVGGAGRGTGRTVWIFFDPWEKEDAVRAWLAPLIRGWAVPPRWVAQPDGGLGERLQYAFHKGFAHGSYAICAIGTDCPELTTRALERAFATLAAGEGVVGPTTDGGYYLIGIKTECAALFENIPWSSSETLSATRRAAQGEGLCLTELPVLADIDTEADWRRWRGGKAGN